MEKSQEFIQTHCLNCGASVQGNFCYNCSQRARDNNDRSLSSLFGEFLSNIFFIDNRFVHSIWHLLRFPGRMTVEYLKGKRKKFISPVTLFLFVNLIYFFLSTLSDYSLALYDHLYDQAYSGEWTVDWVKSKMKTNGLDFQAFSEVYQKTSDTISKSVMIINVPMIALFVYLMAFKKRRYYYDSLIFSFHFFSLYLASWVMSSQIDKVMRLIAGYEDSVVSEFSFYVFSGAIPLLYAILSIKKFMNIRWYWAVPAGCWVIAAVILANIAYRLIILCLTMWFT